MPFIPHTRAEIDAMLESIGVAEINTLFDEIPAELRCRELDEIPEGLSEMAMMRLLRQRLAKQADLSFIGAGAYEHHIPAAVWELASRGEFRTAYTPYQAEASQGSLQLLYEFQTMMTGLMGMDVSNASLYEGGSALAEAILMAIRSNRRSKSRLVLVPKTLHPHYILAAKSIVGQQGVALELIDFDKATGTIDMAKLADYAGKDVTALVVPQPNFFGSLEDVDALTDWAHEQQALAIAVVNPLMMALVKEPGQWGERGADIACGEGQPLGVPLAYGGPYFGFMCCRQEFVRQMPGRIIGRTEDSDGKPGFSLTLQAREQHIRRSKATSNICTNQGLLVTAATIHMSLMGHTGLKHAAAQSHANTRQLVRAACEINGVSELFSAPTGYEAVLSLPVPAAEVMDAMAERNIQAGFDLSAFFPELGHALLVCATETKTAEDIASFVNTLSDVLASITQSQPTAKKEVIGA